MEQFKVVLVRCHPAGYVPLVAVHELPQGFIRAERRLPECREWSCSEIGSYPNQAPNRANDGCAQKTTSRQTPAFHVAKVRVDHF
jgi:hypothetical protein